MAFDEIMTEKSIASGANLYSVKVQLRDRHSVHALQYLITGDGTVSFTLETSSDSYSWVSNGIKGSGLVKTSGPGSDGQDIIPLRIKPGDFARILVAVTNDTAVITLWFIQK